ncbi:MAG: quinone-dependent dihydroorotate dehydrogenase [Bacteroidales bacterium]
MYKSVIRPLLFLLKPETIHHFIAALLKFAAKIPFLSFLLQKFYIIKDKRLSRDFLGMHFKNPVGLAAGFDKNAELYNALSCFGFSFVEIGTVTPVSQLGNFKPRSFRLVEDKGLINRMGFNNKGVNYAVEQLKKQKPRVIIGGNIGKNTKTPNDKAIEDYQAGFEKIYDHVDYLVINLSCPNIENLNELQDRDHTIQIINELDKLRSSYSSQKPILLKISPDIDQKGLDDVIDIFYQTGLDGIIATNTTTRRDNLKTDSEKIERLGKGGLSGKPITERSTEMIRYLSKKSNYEIPIIGVGGIMTAGDALEKLEAGATLVQIYTGFIYGGPAIVKRINKAILEKMD